MRRIFRPRNIFLAFIALLVSTQADYVNRLNNVCPLKQGLVESQADAIEVAKKETVSGGSREFGASFLDALSKRENCCTVTRERRFYLTIVWHVSLDAGDGRFAQVALSNCGDIYEEGTYRDLEDYRRGR